MHASATKIQKVWRGYVCRRNLRTKQRDEEIALQEKLYHYMATQIQRMWRGYVSRSLRGIPMRNYYKRKALLAKAYNAGESLIKYSEEFNQELAKANMEAKYHEVEAKVAEHAKTFHHLSSTAAIPGVFANPYGEEYAARVHGVPMDARFRAARREIAKEQITASKSREVRAAIIKKQSPQSLATPTKLGMSPIATSAVPAAPEPATVIKHFPILHGARVAPIPFATLRASKATPQPGESSLAQLVKETHISQGVPLDQQSQVQAQHSSQAQSKGSQNAYYLPPIRQSPREQSTAAPMPPQPVSATPKRNQIKRGSIAELDVTVPAQPRSLAVGR